MDYLELFGVITGLICVYFNTRQNLWGWPVALLSVSVYAVVFYKAGLYADAGLQVFFFFINVYGLYQWLGGNFKNPGVLEVTGGTAVQHFISILLTIILTGLLMFILKRYTNSDLPFFDGFTTAMSIVAQILLGRKKIENWFYWIFADVIYVGIYIYKGLYPTALLYFIYIFLAAYGYLEWKKSIKTVQTDPAA